MLLVSYPLRCNHGIFNSTHFPSLLLLHKRPTRRRVAAQPACAVPLGAAAAVLASVPQEDFVLLVAVLVHLDGLPRVGGVVRDQLDPLHVRRCWIEVNEVPVSPDLLLLQHGLEPHVSHPGCRWGPKSADFKRYTALVELGGLVLLASSCSHPDYDGRERDQVG